MKRSWSFAIEKGAFWIDVIKGKYGEEERGWSSFVARESYGVGLWKALRRWRHLVSNNLSFVVGDGQRIKFWKDRWCKDYHLYLSFSSLFAIACSKEAWVGDI